MKKLLNAYALFLFAILSFAGVSRAMEAVDSTSQNLQQSKGDKSEVKKYVENLLDKTIAVLKDSTNSLEVKKEKLKTLLANHLDTKTMSGNTLGPRKKSYTPEQLEEFATAYKEYLINSYADLVKSYNGQKIEIKSTNEVNKDYYDVQTEIISDGDQIFTVNYHVHKKEDKLQIVDIVTEGMSLINTQKAEFMNILNNQDLAALINNLKTKSLESTDTKSLKKKADA
jgi:phospholipid transport system substrate-binding protein